MFCSKCGEKLPDGSKFCGKCGQPVRPISGNPDERQGKRWTSKPVAVPVLAALAVVAIVAATVICVVLFRGKGKNTVGSADSVSGADAGGEDTGTAENGGSILDEVKELFEDEENIIYLPSGYTHLSGDETETSTGRYVYNVDGFVVEGYFYQDEELAATEVIEYNAEGDRVCYSFVSPGHIKQEMSYEYDDSGRAVQITRITYNMIDGEFIESDTVVTNYSYDSSGIVSECTETTNGVTLDYKMEFNSDGTVKACEKDDGEHVTYYEYTYENGYVQSVELAVTGENGYIVHQIMVYDETGTSIVNCGNLLKIWNYVDEELNYTLSYEYISATVTSEGIVLSDEFASQEKVQSKTTKY